MFKIPTFIKLAETRFNEEPEPEAQLGGGRPGARPPLAPERGGARPPLQNEKKERMAKISITGIGKPIELL